MSEMWRVDRDGQSGLRVLREEYVSVYAQCLEEGVHSGAFRAGLDAQTAGSAIFGMVATAALDWLVFTPQKSLGDVEPGLLELVQGAVRA
jgi:hypothetical protein